MKSISGDRNNLPLSILEYDQFTIQLLASIKAYYVSWIDRICLDLSLFHEGTPQDHVKVRLFRQVDNMCGFSLANSDRQLTDTYGVEKKMRMVNQCRRKVKKSHLTKPLYP